MQYQFHTANVSDPTVASFQEYAAMRLSGLDRIAPDSSSIRATLTKVGKQRQFELKVELNAPGRQYFVRTTEPTITEAVDKVNKLLKRQIRK